MLWFSGYLENNQYLISSRVHTSIPPNNLTIRNTCIVYTSKVNKIDATHGARDDARKAASSSRSTQVQGHGPPLPSIVVVFESMVDEY